MIIAHPNKHTLQVIRRILALSFIFFKINATAQEVNSADANQQEIVVEGQQYGRSSSHQRLWGKHYRQEWTTPVVVPVLFLDTVSGGLHPYQAGGGRQSKSLRLKDAQNREWVLRSIDKSFTGALP